MTDMKEVKIKVEDTSDEQEVHIKEEVIDYDENNGCVSPASTMPRPEDEEEEDIPPDFFDDFSNQDFMEGLDVVDTWDDDMQEDGEVVDDSATGGDKKSTEQKGSAKEKKRLEAKKSRRARRHARITFSKERDGEGTSRSDRGARYKDLRERIKRSDDKSGSDTRRDPEKTRRDILRDKDRCAKDKEVKLMKEKLKVVETGLVPPGMEMEVDLAELSSLRVQNRVKTVPGVYPPVELKQSRPRFKSRSRSYDRYRLRGRSRSRSREKRRARDDISPIFRKRLRSRSRSPYTESIHRYMRLRERDHSNESRDRRLSRDLSRDNEMNISGENTISPRSKRRTREGDRSRSRSSDRRLTRRYRRSLSPRRRSISPERKRLDYKKDSSRRIELDSKQDKPSFLEEIQRKLNAPVSSVQFQSGFASTQQTPSGSLPSVLPNPFAPQMIPPVLYEQTASQYDQQFFIGTGGMSAGVPQPVSAPMPFLHPTPVPPPQNQIPNSFVSPNNNYSNQYQTTTQQGMVLEDPDKTALAKVRIFSLCNNVYSKNVVLDAGRKEDQLIGFLDHNVKTIRSDFL